MYCSRLAILTLPQTIDPDTGKPCPHQCDVKDFEGAANYEPSTRKLTIYPNKINLPRLYIVKCTITDQGYPPKTTLRIFNIKVVESLNENSLKNKLILAPFIEYFSEKGEITMQMGYEFSKGLEAQMINETVINLDITSRNPITFKQPVKFEWNVTELHNKSFKIQLYFSNITNLTPRDLLKIRFMKPEIFYINRTMNEPLGSSSAESDIDEIDS